MDHSQLLCLSVCNAFENLQTLQSVFTFRNGGGFYQGRLASIVRNQHFPCWLTGGDASISGGKHSFDLGVVEIGNERRKRMPLAVLPITALEAQSEKYQRVYSDESQTERLKALLGADRVEFGGAADGSHVAVGEEVVVPRSSGGFSFATIGEPAYLHKNLPCYLQKGVSHDLLVFKVVLSNVLSSKGNRRVKEIPCRLIGKILSKAPKRTLSDMKVLTPKTPREKATSKKRKKNNSQSDSAKKRKKK